MALDNKRMQNTQRFTWHFIPWSSSFLLYDSNYACLASKTQRKEKRLIDIVFFLQGLIYSELI